MHFRNAEQNKIEKNVESITNSGNTDYIKRNNATVVALSILKKKQ